MSETVLAEQWSAKFSMTTQDDLMRRPITAEDIRPRPERLLVRRVKREEKTPGGIVLPEQSRDISQLGTVEAAGDRTTIAVGTMIIFSAYAASPCIATGDSRDELLFVREHDVLAEVITD